MLSHGLGVCQFARLFVCYTLEPYQNGASQDHEIFTVGCSKCCNFEPLSEGVPLERGHQRGVTKKRYFAVIGSSSVGLQIGTDMLLIITSTGHRLSLIHI